MTTEKIKQDMMELWKDTFHDSNRYIELLFGTYFMRENAFTIYDENRLIASLLMIGYEFRILTKTGKSEIKNGFYLCGLATVADHRGRGIMTELMLDAEQAALRRGYDFTFLIPADAHLRDYYEKRGYKNASFRKTIVLENEKKIDSPKLNIYTIKELLNNRQTNLLREVAEWCHKIELERATGKSTIIHSVMDMMAVMEENENSIFLTKDTFNLKNPNLADIRAVVFPDIPKDTQQPIRVVGAFMANEVEVQRKLSASTEEIYKTIEQTLLKDHPGRRVKFTLPYCRMQTDTRGVTPYAMVKPLKQSLNPHNYEIERLQICLMMD